MKRIWFFLGCLVVAGSLPAEDITTPPADSAKVITLAEAVDQALKNGDAAAQIQANLDASKAAANLASAKNSFVVSTNLGYGASTSGSSAVPAGQTFTAVPNSTLYSATTNSSGGTVIPTTSVGSESANGVLLQNPTVSVTAGTPMTTLTVGAGSGVQSYADGTSRNVATATAKVTQTIWNGYWGGPTQASADKASMAFEAARLNSNASRNAAVLTVKQAYFTMLSAQENIILLQATLDSWKKTLQITQFKFDQQTETAVDVLTAQVSVRSAELNLASGQNALATARRRLANLMGIPVDSPFQITTEPDPTTPAKTLAEAIAIGLQNRPEPQIADLNARSSQVDLNLALGANIPSVTVTGGLTDYIDTTYSNKSTLVAQVGVTLGAALWDAGAEGSSVAQADRTRQAYLTQLHQLHQSIPVDIQEGWEAWQIDLQKLAVSVDNQKAFDLLLEITRTQFQSGQKALSDLLTAQTNASNADFGLLQAKITAQLAALQLQTLLGL